jgi:uncharacterized ferritin-like protein (DUF455 family)
MADSATDSSGAASGELRRGALAALRATTVEARLRAVRRLAAGAQRCDVEALIEAPADIPGRPARPLLVASSAVPARPVGTVEGRAALLHALAHIEFNAIGLALDHLWRFAGLPAAYYRDWATVAVEEAQHFTLLRGRLLEAGFDYGDFPAHDGLWEMARRTTGDVLERMALVPRALEARGLDASPAVRAKFASVGDLDSARVIDVILRDEIGHVAIGNRWFRHLCAQRGVDPAAIQRQAAQRLGAPRLRGPLNIEARLQAGFTPEEVGELLRTAA